MNILTELMNLISKLHYSVATGVKETIVHETYVVLTPLCDRFEVYADGLPTNEVSEVRISIFTKSSYTRDKNKISRALLGAGFTITDRRFISYDDTTGYFHYAMDVAKEYEFDLEE